MECIHSLHGLGKQEFVFPAVGFKPYRCVFLAVRSVWGCVSSVGQTRPEIEAVIVAINVHSRKHVQDRTAVVASVNAVIAIDFPHGRKSAVLDFDFWFG